MGNKRFNTNIRNQSPSYPHHRQLLFKRVVMMLVVCFGLLLPQSDAHAAAELEITPLTWNVIGLDSNNVSVGPNTFPVGARVCNVGDAAATDVVSSFVWDSGTDTYIALRSGSLTEFTTSNGFSVDSLAAGDCYDFYYEVAVTRTAASYDQTRRYHITASAQGIAEVSTPTPRELLVERLISQNRNSTLNMYLDGVLIPAGGSMNLLEGETYHIKLEGSTATNGSGGRHSSPGPRRGASATTTTPSSRWPNDTRAYTGRGTYSISAPALASTSTAVRLSSSVQSSSHTNASTGRTPAATARVISRTPSIRNRFRSSRPRHERNRAASFTRGFCRLVMRCGVMVP